jgi:hypothetical protein
MGFRAFLAVQGEESRAANTEFVVPESRREGDRRGSRAFEKVNQTSAPISENLPR